MHSVGNESHNEPSRDMTGPFVLFWGTVRINLGSWQIGSSDKGSPNDSSSLMISRDPRCHQTNKKPVDKSFTKNWIDSRLTF